MIKMIAGTFGCRIDGKLTAMTPSSGPFSTDAATEERLVRIGVAELVKEVKAETPKHPKAETPKAAGKNDAKKSGKADETPKQTAQGTDEDPGQTAQGDEPDPPDLGAADTVVN